MKKVEIYTTPICGFCHAAKRLLTNKGVAFEESNVMMSSSKRAEMLERSGGRTSVPQIFIGGEHVGGFDELSDLEFDEKLDAMLAA